MIRKLRKLAKAKAILKSYGYTYDSHFEHQDNIYVSFDGDHSMVSVLEDILMAKSAAEIEKDAEWYSCCGDTIDHDIPMCPSCKEWC